MAIASSRVCRRHSGAKSARCPGSPARFEEGDALLMQCMTPGFEMHQMRAAAELDVALLRRGGEGGEEGARILVRHEPVPFAAQQSDRRAHEGGIIGEL